MAISFVLILVSCHYATSNPYRPDIVLAVVYGHLTATMVVISACMMLRLTQQMFDDIVISTGTVAAVSSLSWIGVVVVMGLYQKHYDSETAVYVLILYWVLTILLALGALIGVVGFLLALILAAPDYDCIKRRRRASRIYFQKKLCMDMLFRMKQRKTTVRNAIKSYIDYTTSGIGSIILLDRNFLALFYSEVHRSAVRRLAGVMAAREAALLPVLSMHGMRLDDGVCVDGSDGSVIVDVDVVAGEAGIEMEALDRAQGVAAGGLQGETEEEKKEREAKEKKLKQEEEKVRKDLVQFRKEMKSMNNCGYCDLEFKPLDWVIVVPKCFHYIHYDCMRCNLIRQVRCSVCSQNIKPEMVNAFKLYIHTRERDLSLGFK